MGFFDTVELLKEKTTVFKGETVQSVGVIPQGVNVSLKLDSANGNLVIVYTKTQTVTLVYERVLGFSVGCTKSYEADQVSNAVGQVLARGGLGRGVAGQVGRLVGGGLVGRQKEIVRWIGTLFYTNKNGEREELQFIEKVGDEYYSEETKSAAAKKFETAVNKVAMLTGDNLTEL